MKRIPLSRGIYLIPSLCTTGSLFCGFYAIVHAILQDFTRGCLAIFLAAVFDMLDGRIARMTHSESDFGVEYDSLVDLASFGLAPGILLYTWVLKDFQRVGWLAAFVYFACGALRLARYNIQIETIEKKRFQGLPIPLAAMTVASFIMLYEGKYGPESFQGAGALTLSFVLGLLMVSKIRYRSFKDLDLRNRNTFSILVAAVGLILVMALNPDLLPFFVFLGYILSGPVEELVLLSRARRERARRKMAEDVREEK